MMHQRYGTLSPVEELVFRKSGDERFSELIEGAYNEAVAKWGHSWENHSMLVEEFRERRRMGIRKEYARILSNEESPRKELFTPGLPCKAGVWA